MIARSTAMPRCVNCPFFLCAGASKASGQLKSKVEQAAREAGERRRQLRCLQND